MLRNFLNNIRHLQLIAEKKNHNIKWNQRVKDDLNLAIKFLKRVNKGVSMNTMVFRKSDTIYICDASEHGSGGYDTHGRAWHWEIPDVVKFRAHTNVLENLAQLISIWIDKEEGATNSQDCLLAMGDNTSAMGWLRRSNFLQKDEDDSSLLIKQAIGRKIANLILESDTVLYKQWLKGAFNLVADSLSRDYYFSDYKSH